MRFYRSTFTKLLLSISILALLAAGTYLLALRIPAVSTLEGPRIGQPAPEFTLGQFADPSAPTITTPREPATLSLHDLRGRPVLLLFFYSACPLCLREALVVNRVMQAEAPQHVALLLIDVDAEAASPLESFLVRSQLAVPILLDQGRAVTKQYAATLFPALYLVDSAGILVFSAAGLVGSDRLEMALDAAAQRCSGCAERLSLVQRPGGADRTRPGICPPLWRRLIRCP